MRHLALIMLGLAVLFYWSNAEAGVSQSEAERLGTILTPFGAEKGGSPDGAIPPYTGGLPANTTPVGFKSGTGRWSNPFPDEKPLYSVTTRNVSRFRALLSETNKALFRKYPTYRMDVYPTHRTVAYPAWVLENIKKNATNAHLTEDGLAVEGAVGGIPFPIPQNGNEAMWNHMLVYNGYPAEYRGRNCYVDKNGQAVNTGVLQCSLQSDFYTPGWDAEKLKENGNSFFKAAYHFLFPPSAVGNASYAVDTLNPVKQPRRAWSYSNLTQQVRQSPDLTYDTPIASQGGITYYDEGYMFLGKLDHFDYKLLGKQKMLIPYNNYSMVFDTESSRLLTPNYLNPDFVRWEIHRVWVVEATRKPGKRHGLARRIFYLDEDWSGAGMSDAFGRGHQLIKGIYMAATPIYDMQIPMARCYWAYDLTGGVYTLLQHFGDPGMWYRIKAEGFPEKTFSPEALPERGK